ncbi:MAG: hypothetical protein E7Z96_02575 [Actinomycetaceae bacterium]|nr:hypothetical protein [Actinomycetaceae bacterium]
MAYYTQPAPTAYESIAKQAADMLYRLHADGLLRAPSQRIDPAGADLLRRQLDALAEEIYEDMADPYQRDTTQADQTGYPVAPWRHASIPTWHCCQLIAALQWAVQTQFDRQHDAGEEIS